MIGTILQNRYLIEDELGRGGMGVVYRAHDRVLNRPVAIKIISENGIGSSGRARLLAEAQAVARLNHPNIVAVYDAGEAENITYLVMELIAGSSLRSISELSLSKALDIGIQICSALEEAHASGIIHRDLKPENILITPSRTVKDSVNAKLMDFGLARQLDAASQSGENLTQAGAIVGTLAYIAPEIIRGEPPSALSDLYSLGLVLYEMVTGRPAYSGKDLISILSQHLHASVEPPSTHQPAIPPDLEALILRLVEKLPEHRPASAGEVRQALEALRSGQTLELATQPAGGPLDRIVRGRLVAREHELAEMWSYWKRAIQGESRVLLISGEPGIGKTRLVKELLTRVALSGGKTLFGECQAYGGAPYAPIAQIIDQALLVNEEASELPPLVLADLISLAPNLMARYNAPPNPALDPQAEQQRLFASFSVLCEHVASQGPLLLALDDAHWADRGSLDLLRYLARRAARAHMRLLIIFTYREIELSEARALNEMLADLGRERLPNGSSFAARIKLTRFSRQQTGELLKALLAEPASDDLRDSIYQETEGNPFFVEEVVKTLVEEGIIYRSNGRWERCNTDEVRVPQSVRLAIEGRIARLPEAVQEVLRLAAILGRRFDFETLRQACDKSEDELIEAIEGAQRVQLIEEVGGGYGGVYVLSFTHALIPAALVDGIGGLRRRRLHRKAVEVIARLHPDDFESLAHHSAEAADDALALDYYAKAADRARRLYANQDAIRLYSEALALLSEKEADQAALEDGSLYRQRFNLLLNRAGVYDIQGQRPEQLADIQSMLAIAGPQGLDDPALHCDALIALAAYNQIVGQGQVVEPAQQALELARQLDDLARQGAAYSVLAIFEMNRYESVTGREYFRQAIESLRTAGLKAAVAHNLNWLSNLEIRAARHDEARKLLEEAIAISREIGDRRLEALNLRRMAINLINLNRYAEALPLSLQAVDLHRQVGDRVSEVNAENVIALCYEDLGEMEKAEEHFMRSLAMAEEIDMVLGIYHVVFNLVENYYPLMGEYEKALAAVDDGLRRPEFQGDDFFIRNLLDRKNDLLAQLGQYEVALEIARDVLRRNMEAENWEQAFSSIMRVGYILVELERFDEARQQYDQALHIAEGIQEAEKRALVFAHWGLGFWHFRQGASLGGNLLPEPDAVFLQQARQHFNASLEIAQEVPSKGDEDGIDAVSMKAITEAELGDHEAALQSIRRVQDYLAAKPRPRHLTAYLAVAYVLHVTGQPGALEALRPAYERFMMVADKLHDPALRESYLNSTTGKLMHRLWEKISKE